MLILFVHVIQNVGILANFIAYMLFACRFNALNHNHAQLCVFMASINRTDIS
jgi:hypothetical protein